MKDFLPHEWSLSKRLLATVAYFDVFDLPLNEKFLGRLIFGNSDFIQDEIDIAMRELNGLIEKKDNYFFLAGRINILEKFVEHQKIYNFLIDRARHAKCILRAAPFVEFTAICNYLPLGVVDEKSDIDLFVITKPNRIFTARFFLTVFFHITGKRRHSNKIKNRFCLSFYLNRQYLSLHDLLIKPKDFYMAYWMIALLPIYGEEKIYLDLMRENSFWLDEYFTNSLKRVPNCSSDAEKIIGKNFCGSVLEFLLHGRIGDVFENFLKSYFLKRHASNVPNLPLNASVEVSEKRLKFHNDDRRKFFYEEFEKRLKRLKFF